MRTSTTSKITSISFSEDYLIVFTDNQKYQWKISDISKRLFSASETERNIFTISPSGYGIHWPTIDEDLSLMGLLNRSSLGA